MQRIAKQNDIGRYAWLVVAVTFLIGVAGSLVSNKVPPITPALMQVFDVDLTQAGMLTFYVSLVSLLMAFPAGLLVQRIGVRRTGILGLSLLITGGVLVILWPKFNMMMAGRVFEGLGIAILTIVPPAAIALFFSAEKSGLPMGIWSTATPIGGFLAMTLVPALELKVGWSGVWLFCVGFALLALLIFMLFVRQTDQPVSAQQQSVLGALKSFSGNRDIWLLGFSLMFFSFSFMPTIIYYPTFLHESFNMSLVKAGWMVGIISLVNLPGSPLTGWISDRLGTRRLIIVAGYILLIPVSGLVFYLPQGWVIVNMILIGLASSMAATLIFTAAPEMVSDAGSKSLSLGLITALMNLGTMISIPLFGELVERFGWQVAAISNMVAAVLGLSLMLFIRRLK